MNGDPWAAVAESLSWDAALAGLDVPYRRDGEPFLLNEQWWGLLDEYDRLAERQQGRWDELRARAGLPVLNRAPGSRVW